MSLRNSTSGSDWLWIGTRWAIYARDGFRCIACGRGDELSIDHVDAGCGNAPTNLVTLCMRCNREKHERSYRQWRPELVDVVAMACASPIDRRLGRELAAEYRPSRLAAHSYRTRRDVRRKRAAAAAEAIADFCADGLAGAL